MVLKGQCFHKTPNNSLILLKKKILSNKAKGSAENEKEIRGCVAR